MDKVISIIIPTYNMEGYLDKCLSSLIIGKMESVEVVVVNDGSTDASLAIAQSYVKKYPNSFSVINKENGNYGSCINAGLYSATGKYIKVLDADDSFYTANFEKMVTMLEKIDVDLFLTDFIRVYSDREKESVLHFPNSVIVNFTKECVQNKKLLSSIWMHNITYKRENLIKVDYKQSEGIFYTDNEWKFKPMVTVKSAFYWKEPVYRYLLVREGQSVDDVVKARHVLDDILVTMKILKDYNDMIVLNPEMKEVYYYTVYRRIAFIYKANIVKRGMFDNQDLLKFDRELKKLSPEFYDEVGRRKLSKILLPFQYIKMWRKNPNGKLLKFIVELKKMGSCRVKKL